MRLLFHLVSVTNDRLGCMGERWMDSLEEAHRQNDLLRAGRMTTLWVPDCAVPQGERERLFV